MSAPDPCACPLAGLCERHGFTKTRRQHELCQTRDDYRAMWDGVPLRRARAPVTTTSPGPLRMIWNFAKATVAWRRSGALRVSEAEYDLRRASCEGCEALVRIPLVGMQCTDCGCFIAIKAARNTTPGESDCPRGRWSPVSVEDSTREPEQRRRATGCCG